MSALASVQTEAVKKPRKLSVTQIKLHEQASGYEFEGKFKGVTLGAPFAKVDDKSGDVVTQQMTFCVFESRDGSRFKVNQDKGLETGLSDAMVKEGDCIKVVKLDKVQIGKGRTMNSYDIYEVEKW